MNSQGLPGGMQSCGDCLHAMENADDVLWCYEPTRAGPAPGGACERFEREPGADAGQRDPHRVFYDHGGADHFGGATEMVCRICGKTGHVAANCKRGAA